MPKTQFCEHIIYTTVEKKFLEIFSFMPDFDLQRRLLETVLLFIESCLYMKIRDLGSKIRQDKTQFYVLRHIRIIQHIQYGVISICA
jgi:hypothetical protein